jgi:cobalt/nickel transport system permease protein
MKEKGIPHFVRNGIPAEPNSVNEAFPLDVRAHASYDFPSGNTRMHIPDGYLSPQTYIPAYAVMTPFWIVASRKLQATLRMRQTPMLALAAAFSFVIMMFNVPIPGGTTGHAVGSVLIAILLGPWAAVIAVSIALTIQALMFGDGGVTAIGANCLNMAVIMPFVGYAVYRLIAGPSQAGSSRHKLGAAVGGYVGLNAAALATGIMFGIQPMIARDSHGHALYAPFGLSVAVPAMVAGHLLMGFVEAIVTGLVVAYVQRTEPSMIRVNDAPNAGFVPKLALGLALLVVLTPLGLYIPARFGAGSAWGEWSAEEIKGMAGYVPRGLSHLGSIWRAPIPDYEFGSGGALTYVISGLAGTLVIVLVVFLLRKLSKGRKAVGTTAEVDDKQA